MLLDRLAAADGEGGGSGGEKQAGFLKAAASQPKEQRPQLDTQPADDDAFILWLGQKVRLAGSLRPRLHLAASAAGSSSAVKDQIFNRKEELAALNLRFDKNPKDMLILLGPANCGKTKLLQEVKKDREFAQAVIGEGPPPILYLDCRGKDISSPKKFANAIRQLVIGDAGLKNWWAGVKIKLPGLELDLEKIFEQAAGKPPMESIIDSLTTFLEATRPLPYKPVIIIDEANKLMRWSDDPGHIELKKPS
ncbi:hypothetical protein KSW81_006161 [Nannochloris sp. 'desiccata']|nr:hypothetical protein KSW81_006161 [Chlorella desiccata (nom. nud.)]